MKVTELARRYNGQILSCEFGHLYPLNLYSTGFVKILIEVTQKGNIKMKHIWAATKEELS
jgi:hypothetical protein